MPRPGPALPLLAPLLATLVALAAVVNATARPGLGRQRIKDPEVHSFGAREPGDTELWTKVLRRKQMPTKGRLDTVRYPPAGGDSNNVVTYVTVTVPQRTLTKDEVRITDGGPGMKHVVVTVGGRRSFHVDFAVTVYGHELGASTANTPVAAGRANRRLPQWQPQWQPQPATEDASTDSSTDTSTGSSMGSSSTGASTDAAQDGGDKPDDDS